MGLANRTVEDRGDAGGLDRRRFVDTHCCERVNEPFVEAGAGEVGGGRHGGGGAGTVRRAIARCAGGFSETGMSRLYTD